ncbi:hypothetical protein [Acinetobacter nosocomialis]|uniref:hypothetical protein n=1 Tax=Acinetobacter nosocomialis TaxID=106654 RepID=UPI00125E00A8|nr:hypothetical protein [Acinetobacter nosocomialis]
MAAKREIKTPGVTAEQNQEQQAQTPDTTQDTSTKDQAEAALAHITKGDDQNTGETGPTQEELLQLVADMKDQMAKMMNASQFIANPNSGPISEVIPKKRIPVLTDKGWSTKEAD